jgi:hypothetical protein
MNVLRTHPKCKRRLPVADNEPAENEWEPSPKDFFAEMKRGVLASFKVNWWAVFFGIIAAIAAIVAAVESFKRGES